MPLPFMKREYNKSTMSDATFVNVFLKAFIYVFVNAKVAVVAMMMGKDKNI